jgi:hypothetical protein
MWPLGASVDDLHVVGIYRSGTHAHPVLHGFAAVFVSGGNRLPVLYFKSSFTTGNHGLEACNSCSRGKFNKFSFTIRSLESTSTMVQAGIQVKIDYATRSRSRQSLTSL